MKQLDSISAETLEWFKNNMPDRYRDALAHDLASERDGERGVRRKWKKALPGHEHWDGTECSLREVIAGPHLWIAYRYPSSKIGEKLK